MTNIRYGCHIFYIYTTLQCYKVKYAATLQQMPKLSRFLKSADISRYICTCRTIAIYGLPINLRYIYKRCSLVPALAISNLFRFFLHLPTFARSNLCQKYGKRQGYNELFLFFQEWVWLVCQGFGFAVKYVKEACMADVITLLSSSLNH